MTDIGRSRLGAIINGHGTNYAGMNEMHCGGEGILALGIFLRNGTSVRYKMISVYEIALTSIQERVALAWPSF